MRFCSATKPSLRPVSCTGWKLTPRTQRHCAAWRRTSPISPSLTPLRTVATRVVDRPTFSRLARAIACVRRRSVPRIVCSAARLSASELQIDLEARHVFGEPRGEIGLGSDADAVGVQHKVADIAALCGGDDREQLRVQGRLAAADLQQIGLAFA